MEAHPNDQKQKGHKFKANLGYLEGSSLKNNEKESLYFLASNQNPWKCSVWPSSLAHLRSPDHREHLSNPEPLPTLLVCFICLFDGVIPFKLSSCSLWLAWGKDSHTLLNPGLMAPAEFEFTWFFFPLRDEECVQIFYTRPTTWTCRLVHVQKSIKHRWKRCDRLAQLTRFSTCLRDNGYTWGVADVLTWLSTCHTDNGCTITWTKLLLWGSFLLLFPFGASYTPVLSPRWCFFLF